MQGIFSYGIVFTVLLATCYSAAVVKPNLILAPNMPVESQPNKIVELAKQTLNTVTVKASSVGNEESLAIKVGDGIFDIIKKFETQTNKALGYLLSQTMSNAVDTASENDLETSSQNVTQKFIGLAINANVGNPPQQQSIYLNFLTADFWIVGKDYYFSRFINNIFNEDDSETFARTDSSFKLDLQNYRAKGLVGEDTVSFGKFSVPQKVKVAQSTSILFPLLGVNGFLGIAANADGKSALTDLLASAEERVLTLYYNPLANILSTATNAVYATFGGSDSKLCQDDWKTVQAESVPFWTVDVFGITTDANPHKNKEAQKGMIFNSVWVTLVPERTLHHIVKIIDAVEVKKQYGIYMVSCDTDSLPTLKFNLGDQEVPLTPENYIVNVKGLCFLKIFEMKKQISEAVGVDFVFGEPLFRSNCAKFNPEAKTIQFSTPNGVTLEY